MTVQPEHRRRLALVAQSARVPQSASRRGETIVWQWDPNPSWSVH